MIFSFESVRDEEISYNHNSMYTFVWMIGVHRYSLLNVSYKF